MESNTDRRKHTRFLLRDGSYAGVYPNIGEIIDISLGGISYNYMDITGDDSVRGEFVVCSDDGFCLESLPSKKVDDIVVENGSSFSTIIARNCRIMFDKLNDDQKRLLYDFIQTHRIL